MAAADLWVNPDCGLKTRRWEEIERQLGDMVAAARQRRAAAGSRLTRMLSAPAGWVEMVEVNPPRLPDMTHRELTGRWQHVLITDNPFKQVRVSPYAFAARITHDVPDVIPTVVCSTRDRNILAIESEVRGALGNGVDSFLVVQGDMLPEVEHWSNSYEIVEHLRALQESMPSASFEVGMSTRSRQLGVPPTDRPSAASSSPPGRSWIPTSVQACADRLELRPDDPPVYLELAPPFSIGWVRRLEIGRRHPDRRCARATAWRDARGRAAGDGVGHRARHRRPRARGRDSRASC